MLEENYAVGRRFASRLDGISTCLSGCASSKSAGLDYVVYQKSPTWQLPSERINGSQPCQCSGYIEFRAKIGRAGENKHMRAGFGNLEFLYIVCLCISHVRIMVPGLPRGYSIVRLL